MNLRETGRSRAVSPLDLGGEPLKLPPGDGSDISPEERGPEDGWKALWRLVNDHKSRQALERNAAKKARGRVGVFHWAPTFSVLFSRTVNVDPRELLLVDALGQTKTGPHCTAPPFSSEEGHGCHFTS